MSQTASGALTAFVLIIIIIVAALLTGSRGADRQSAPHTDRTRGAMRCPYCGSPVMIRGRYWECGYCGDSGRLKR